MSINNGWLLIHRCLFKKTLWLSEPFTKAQAWIDLFGNANFEDGSFWVRGTEIKIKRGQLGWSEVTMAERWQWSRNKVRRFLKWLETEQQIEQLKNNITSIITIINYDKHQPMAQQTAQQTEQQKDIKRYTINELKEELKKRKEELAQSHEKDMPPEPALEPPIEFKNLELYLQDKKLIKAWPKLYPALKAAYPNVDILNLIRKLHAWEMARPNRRKVDRPKFFQNRCRSEQDKYNPTLRPSGSKLSKETLPPR